jgi:hypothetical protein
MVKKTIQYLLLLACTIGWTNTIFADSPEDEYPPAPVGIVWGWQGEVLFDFDKAVIRKGDKVTLDQIATTLQQYSEVNLLVTGHTDNSGNLEYNRKLSARRGDAIVNYLVKKGIVKHRIIVQATGEERPVTNNACPEDRERNRRADLAFFPNGYEYSIKTPESMRDESQPQAGECEELKARLQPKPSNIWQ